MAHAVSGASAIPETRTTRQRAPLADSVLPTTAFVVLGAPFDLLSQDGAGVFGALPSPALVVVWLAYYVWPEGSRGQTLVKMLLGTRSSGRTPAERPGSGLSPRGPRRVSWTAYRSLPRRHGHAHPRGPRVGSAQR